jgi:hypothetical protein
MQGTSFNTHSVVKKLVARGLKEPVAEEKVEVILEGKRVDLSQLASKKQFLELKMEIEVLKKDVEGIKKDMATKTDIETVRTEIERVKNQPILMIGASVVATCTIVVGFLKYFLHH